MMNDFEKRKCLELTTKMQHRDLCRPFKEKVDPVRDGALDYYTYVTKPMDLSLVKRKLNNNDYYSMNEWAEDVNQIWKNAMIYNNEGTLIYLIAQEMELWFKKKFESIPRNKDEEWMTSLRKSTKKLFDLSLHPSAQIVAMRQSSKDDIPYQPAATDIQQENQTPEPEATTEPPSESNLRPATPDVTEIEMPPPPPQPSAHESDTEKANEPVPQSLS